MPPDHCDVLEETSQNAGNLDAKKHALFNNKACIGIQVILVSILLLN